jgi:hypothetical protein
LPPKHKDRAKKELLSEIVVAKPVVEEEEQVFNFKTSQQ